MEATDPYRKSFRMFCSQIYQGRAEEWDYIEDDLYADVARCLTTHELRTMLKRWPDDGQLTNSDLTRIEDEHAESGVFDDDPESVLPTLRKIRTILDRELKRRGDA